VLAVLALEVNQLVSVDRLVDLTWPGSPPRTAHHAIHVRVSQLRAVLARAGVGRGDVEIITRGSAYLLQANPMRVDTHRFRALVAEARAHPHDAEKAALFRHALGMWRGPPLADVTTAEVADRLCRGLEETRLVALEECLDAELRIGRHRAVVDELTELAARHPYRQHLLAQLMLALYRAGRAPDALGVYRLARSRLVDELGLDPEPRLQRLESAILCADPALDLSRSQLGSTPPHIVPARLPPDIGSFTGRAEQLAELTSLLPAGDTETASLVVIAITGTAGVGKTALAVHWAHQVADQFDGGQLYVSLRGIVRGSPARPIEALAHLLHALGVEPAEVPADLDRAADMYQSLLAGRRALVVLDDAASSAQVRLLLPRSAGCCTLIISRDELADLAATHGAHRIELDVLRPAEADRSLTGILGPEFLADPDAADKSPATVTAVRVHMARLLAAVGEYQMKLAELYRGQAAAVAQDPAPEQQPRVPGSLADAIRDELDGFVGRQLLADLPRPAPGSGPEHHRHRRTIAAVLASALTAAVVSVPAAWSHLARSRAQPGPVSMPPTLGSGLLSGTGEQPSRVPLVLLSHDLHPAGYDVEHWWQHGKQGSVISLADYEIAVAHLTVHDPGTFSPDAQQAGRAVTVNSRRGYLLAQRNSKIGVTWEYQPRAWAVIEGTTTSTSQSDLIRLAEQVRFGPARAMRFPYRLTYLPRGLQLQGARQSIPNARTEGLSSLQLATGPAGSDEAEILSVLVSGPWDSEQRAAQGSPDSTVAGRPAWYEPDKLQLVVDFGQCVVTVEHASYPEQELLRIAEGMHLATWTNPDTWTDNPLP
jgi:DNA-binding SARP family transcriptional activator